MHIMTYNFSEDITGGLVYLLSDSADYCTEQNLIVEGGFTSW
jgi:hypothetical protein